MSSNWTNATKLMLGKPVAELFLKKEKKGPVFTSIT